MLIGTVASNAGCALDLDGVRRHEREHRRAAALASTASRPAPACSTATFTPVTRPAASSVARRLERPASAGLEQRERDGVVARHVTGRVAQRRAAEERHAREVRAEHAGDQTQLDRAEPFQRAELRERGPQPATARPRPR